jgi:hypothetical protein
MPTELPTPAKSWSQLWQMTKLLVRIWLARFRRWLRRFGRPE